MVFDMSFIFTYIAFFLRRNCHYFHYVFFQERQETPFSVTPFVTQQRFTVSFSTVKLRLLNNDLVSS